MFMSDGAKIVIDGIMAYTIYRVAGKCTDARIAIAAMILKGAKAHND